MDLEKIYRIRFKENDLANKNRIWKILCEDFFSRYIKDTDIIVDIGAGYCEFINNIKGGGKIAVDLNIDTKKNAGPDVQVINESYTAINSLKDNSADIVFMSNFLEHLPDKNSVYKTLKESKRILKMGGKLILLQPNIRFLSKEYWDFFDHITPLSDRSLIEALESLDMKIITCYPKFLPYTTRSGFPKGNLFIKIYLRLPILWKFFGKQAFIIAKKPLL